MRATSPRRQVDDPCPAAIRWTTSNSNTRGFSRFVRLETSSLTISDPPNCSSTSWASSAVWSQRSPTSTSTRSSSTRSCRALCLLCSLVARSARTGWTPDPFSSLPFSALPSAVALRRVRWRFRQRVLRGGRPRRAGSGHAWNRRSGRRRSGGRHRSGRDALRRADLDAFLGEAPLQRLDQLVLEQALVVEVFRAHHHGEPDERVAEGVEARDRLE